MTLRISNCSPVLCLRTSPPNNPPGRRTFLTAFSQEPVRISIRRTIPFAAPLLYPIIADVDSYSQFLPFCMGSIVTKRDTKNHPTHADLRVGWNGWSETFSSRVFCGHNTVTADASGHPLFQHLRATWTLGPIEIEKAEKATTVSLGVEYNFTNPLYNSLAKKFAPQVAEKLVKAFEKRAIEKVG